MDTKNTPPSNEMPFGKKNYMLLIIGVGILASGFFLMTLDKTFVDAREFSLSLYVAPIVIVAGFAQIIYAILAKSEPKN